MAKVLCRGALRPLLGTCLKRLQIRTNHSQPTVSLSSPQSLVIRPCILATGSSLAEQLIHLPSASLTPCEWEMRGSHLLLWQPGKLGGGWNCQPSLLLARWPVGASRSQTRRNLPERR